MRKIILTLTLAFSLLGSSSAMAMEPSDNKAVMRGSTEVKAPKENIEENTNDNSISNYKIDANTQGFTNVMNDVSTNMNAAANTETAKNTSASTAKITNKLVQFAMGVIPGVILGVSALELLLLIATPIQPLVEKLVGGGSGSSGGDDLGSSSKGKGLFQLSEDYFSAKKGGSSSGGDLGGSGAGKAGTWTRLKTYLDLRIKLIVISVVAMFLLLTPATFNLTMAAFGHFAKFFNMFTQWLFRTV